MARPEDDAWKGQRKNALGENHIISVRLSEANHEHLHALARKNDTTVAAIVRHTVGQFIEDHPVTRAKQSLFD